MADEILAMLRAVNLWFSIMAILPSSYLLWQFLKYRRTSNQTNRRLLFVLLCVCILMSVTSILNALGLSGVVFPDLPLPELWGSLILQGRTLIQAVLIGLITYNLLEEITDS